ncbi:MAG: glycine zipper 2TM domain-containing protein [Betaproteobacteria bacterium]|nr:glycine zipper 2TM domain-containing protein [Betaproteobacteria bacterium]
MITAAIAVTLFSLVGIGAIMGWIPTSVGGGSAVTPTAQPPASSKTQADAGTPVATAPAQPAVIAEPEKRAPAPAARRAKPRSKPVARSEPPQQVAKVEPAQPAVAEVAPPPLVVAATCRECAVVEEVREVEKAGDASGVGAVGGAVVGGVLGRQVGRGTGRDIATVVGAIGGGIAGHQIEKQVKKTKQYQISVRYEDGSQGLFTQDTPPSWRAGDKVKVVNGILEPRN